MVRVKIKGKLPGFRKYRKKEIAFKEPDNKGFLKVNEAGELFIDRLEAFYGIYARHGYGLYLRGDGTIKGSTLRIKEFASAFDAENFKKELESSPLLEKIKIKLFSHPEEKIFYSENQFITADYYELQYPKLKKYRLRTVEGQEEDWFVFLMKLGLKKEEPPRSGCTYI